MLEGRGLVRVAGRGERRVVWRDCRHGGFFRGLTGDRFLSPRRVLNELRILEEARLAAIPTAEPVGLVIRRFAPGFIRCRLATVFIPGGRDWLSYYRRLTNAPGGRDQAEKNRLIEGFAGLVFRMHRAGFDHADLQMKNLLFAESGAESRFFVIDFDRARRFEELSFHRRVKNLLRLHRSFLKMCFSTGREPGSAPARFLRAYAPADPALRKRVFEKAKKSDWRNRAHRISWKLSVKLKGGCYARPAAR